MKELHGEGLAPHTDPESCVDGRKAGGEALTGARAGRVLSPVRSYQERRRTSDSGRQHGRSCTSLTAAGFSGSETPCMRGTNKCENREIHGLSNHNGMGWGAAGTPRRQAVDVRPAEV